MNRFQKKFVEEYYPKLLRTIESCETVEQFDNCFNWMNNLDLKEIISKLAKSCNYDKLSMTQQWDVDYYAKSYKEQLLDIIDFKIQMLPEEVEEERRPIGFRND